MSDLTANDLKTRGVSALEQALGEHGEATISVRGQPRYVVMSLEHYERWREAEIASAGQEAKAAETSGEYIVEAASEHIARLQREADDV